MFCPARFEESRSTESWRADRPCDECKHPILGLRGFCGSTGSFAARWALFAFVYAGCFLAGMTLVSTWSGSGDRDFLVMLLLASLASYAALQDVFAMSVLGEIRNLVRLLGVMVLLAFAAMVVVQIQRALPLALILLGGVVGSPFLSLTLRRKRVPLITKYLGTPDTHCYVGCWGMSLFLVGIAGAAYSASISPADANPLWALCRIVLCAAILWALFVGLTYRETLTNIMTKADDVPVVNQHFLLTGQPPRKKGALLPRLEECRDRVELAWTGLCLSLLVGVPVLVAQLRTSAWGVAVLSLSTIVGMAATFDPVALNLTWKRGATVSVFCRLSLGCAFLGLYLGRVLPSSAVESPSVLQAFSSLSTLPLVGSLSIVGAVVAAAFAAGSSRLLRPLWPLFQRRLAFAAVSAGVGAVWTTVALQFLLILHWREFAGITRDYLLLALAAWLAVILLVFGAASVLRRVRWYRQRKGDASNRSAAA